MPPLPTPKSPYLHALPYRMSVLVVDDDEEDFLLLRAVASAASDVQLELSWESDFDAALDAISANRFDVYLVDYRLGARSGLELLQATREQGLDAPIILVTGDGNSAVDQRAMELGASDYLVKSELQPALLGRIIRHAFERRADQARLRDRDAQLARLADLVDSSHDAIVGMSLDGTIISWNGGAARLFGYAGREAIGQPVAMLLPQAERDAHRSLLERTGRGETLPGYETGLLDREGRTVPVFVALSPIRDVHGTIIGLSAIAHDVRDAVLARRMRELQHAAAQILSAAESSADALPQLAQVICTGLDWDVCRIWVNREDDEFPTLAAEWDATSPMVSRTHERSNARDGERLASVKVSGQAVWEDINAALDGAAPSATAYRTVCVVPIAAGTQILGIMQFLSLARRPIEFDALGTALAVGRQVGQFLDRQRALAELRAAEERFRSLLNSAAEGIYGLDMRGVCTFANPAAARLLGFTTDQLIGRALHRLIHHSHADGSPYPVQDCRIHLALRHGTDVHAEDEVYWRADGSSFPVEYWSYPIREGGVVTGAVVSFLDVSERQRMLAELSDSELRYRLLTEASFDGVVVTEEGVIVEANRGMSVLGYDATEMHGRRVAEFVAEESRALVMRHTLATATANYEAVALHRDGRKVLLEVTSKALPVAKGRHRRVAALRDITERRLLEDQLRQAQKMEAVGRLAGGVAHDFNNMLTVMRGYTEMLLADAAPGDARTRDLEAIRDAAERAGDLTRQLLAFSRQQVIAPKVIALDEAVDGAERLLRRLIGEDIVLDTRHAEAARVSIDPGQLDQVLMNLAVNARDAMPTGGRLTLETAVVDVDSDYVRLHPDASPGRYAVVTVADTGVGMDAGTRARIFDPFFTTKAPGEGTGLGLPTVYGIVKQAGGFIGVYSEPGEGTTFRIHLPLAAEPVTAPVPATARGAQLRGRETILLAEDEPTVRSTARRILERFGYTVLEASEGREALEVAAAFSGPIHLLLTDVVMPRMSGRELAARFQQLRPGARVLFMSGYTDDAVLRHGVLTRSIAYVEKPFSADSLAVKVREVLDAPGLAPELVYRLDASDQFIAVNDAWDTFAAANEGAGAARAAVLGREIWPFISDVTSRELYRRLHARVRTAGQGVSFNFRCDAPALRRLLRLQLDPEADGGLQYSIQTLAAQEREPVALATGRTGDSLLAMCSWCKRIEAGNALLEIEEAIQALRLFDQTPVPMITHGICPECEQSMISALEADEWSAGGELTFGALAGVQLRMTTSPGDSSR